MARTLFFPRRISSVSGLLAGQLKKQHPHSMQSRMLCSLASSIRLFFTSAEKFIQYCKAGWKDTFSQNSAYTIIKDKSADEVFKYYSFVINNNGTVTVTITNNSFTDAEKAGLSSLSSILSGTLKGYRDGKMYFAYKIKHDDTPTYGVVRNNAYNLTFTGVPGIGDPVPTPTVDTP